MQYTIIFIEKSLTKSKTTQSFWCSFHGALSITLFPLVGIEIVKNDFIKLDGKWMSEWASAQQLTTRPNKTVNQKRD